MFRKLSNFSFFRGQIFLFSLYYRIGSIAIRLVSKLLLVHVKLLLQAFQCQFYFSLAYHTEYLQFHRRL